MRVGILTAGGDCPGLNAAIRAVAKGVMLGHQGEVLGFEDGFVGLVEGRSRRLDYREVSGILDRGGTILGTDNRANPVAYAARGGADMCGEVLAHCDELRLDGLAVIGGDGSMTVALELHRRGLPVVGVPKTIDNDVVGTERTIGFDTAVSIAAAAIDRLHTTAQSHHRVFVIETMGRHAGWIALESGVAGGADVILLPEIDHEVDEVAARCRRRAEGGQRFTIVVVSEGAKPAGGRQELRAYVGESAEPRRLGGIAARLAEELAGRLSCEVRSIELGHLQRGGTPTAGDRVLATLLGAHAVRLLHGRAFGRMAAVRCGELTDVPLAEVGGRSRRVPLDSPLITAALAVGTSFGVRGDALASAQRAGTAS